MKKFKLEMVAIKVWKGEIITYLHVSVSMAVSRVCVCVCVCVCVYFLKTATLLWVLPHSYITFSRAEAVCLFRRNS